MSDGVGLSVGATNLAAVVVGRTAVTRSPVVTLYPHRPPEVGVPSENPNLTERGLIITDFVDRVGDPVGIVAADGSTHLADKVLADALRAMLYAVGRGRPPAEPVAITYPAHWRPAAVDALRNAVAAVPEFQQPSPAPLVSDSTAALTALQDDPGVPTRGVIALCDFGGTGTNITLVDAANGYRADRPDRPPHRSFRRPHRPGAVDSRHQRLVGGGHHRLVRHLGDRLADAAAGPVPRSQGAVVHCGGHLPGGRAARAPQ